MLTSSIVPQGTPTPDNRPGGRSKTSAAADANQLSVDVAGLLGGPAAHHEARLIGRRAEAIPTEDQVRMPEGMMMCVHRSGRIPDDVVAERRSQTGAASIRAEGVGTH